MNSVLSVMWFWPSCIFFTLATTAANGADPVKLSVYYESLCPDSRNFVTDQMYPVYQELKNIMTMDINVYGKANDSAVGEGYAFTCQHGPNECNGNMMLTCAKKYLLEDQYLDFSVCIMNAFIGTSAESLCASILGIDHTAIHKCWNSVEGQLLLHQVGEVERSLNPPVTYVPWILIDDVYTEEQLEAAQEDLRSVICNAYTGEKPEKCL